MTELKLPEVNRVMLSGRLTHEPDRRYAPDGTSITNFPLAFHRRYRTGAGKYAEHTGYVTVMTYQRLAEVCGQYLKKGSAVLVEGRLQMREWQAPQGEKRQRLEIRAESVHFLERVAGGASRGADARSGGEGDLLEPSP
jgi:single-strand DNA-binding protein